MFALVRCDRDGRRGIGEGEDRGRKEAGLIDGRGTAEMRGRENAGESLLTCHE